MDMDSHGHGHGQGTSMRCVLRKVNGGDARSHFREGAFTVSDSSFRYSDKGHPAGVQLNYALWTRQKYPNEHVYVNHIISAQSRARLRLSRQPV